MKPVVGPAAARGPGRALPLVQVLRAIAALMVAVLHIGGEGARLAGMATPAPALALNAGVDVFFVISGFIMVWSSAGLFGTKGARRAFLVRRLARIVPPYWIATTAILAVSALLASAVPAASGQTGASILASYLFVPWPRLDGEVQPVLRLGWSLNYEMFFYAIFAVWVGAPLSRAWRGVLATLLVLVGLGMIDRTSVTAIAFWTSPMLLEFAAGVSLGVVAMRGASLGERWRWVLAVLGVAGLAAVGWRDAGPRWVAYALPGAALVAAAALGKQPRDGVWLRAWVLVGDASYALYLVHPFPMRALSIVWPRVFGAGAASAMGYAAAALAAAILTALAFHAWIERPSTLAARRWLRDGRGPPTQVR